MPQFSHIAKAAARETFAPCGGTAGWNPAHYSAMAKKQPQSRWFAREWRKQKGYSLEKASELTGVGLSYLSDLEKGKRRWNQDHLDALANGYGMDWQDLFWNPETGPPLWRIINQIPEAQREQAAKILETFAKKTGTHG